MIHCGEQLWCVSIRFCTPDLIVETLCLSTLMGCYIRSGCEIHKLSNKKIKFVMDMCKKNQSEDLRNQNTLMFLLYLSKLE